MSEIESLRRDVSRWRFNWAFAVCIECWLFWEKGSHLTAVGIFAVSLITFGIDVVANRYHAKTIADLDRRYAEAVNRRERNPNPFAGGH